MTEVERINICIPPMTDMEIINHKISELVSNLLFLTDRHYKNELEDLFCVLNNVQIFVKQLYTVLQNCTAECTLYYSNYYLL